MLTAGGVIIGCGLGLAMGAANGESLITSLSGASTDAHVFATPKDLYNISYLTFRSFLAILFFVALAKLNHSTWKYKGSACQRAFTLLFATVSFTGVFVSMIRISIASSNPIGVVNDIEFYMTTSRMYIVW